MHRNADTGEAWIELVRDNDHERLNRVLIEYDGGSFSPFLFRLERRDDYYKDQGFKVVMTRTELQRLSDSILDLLAHDRDLNG